MPVKRDYLAIGVAIVIALLFKGLPSEYQYIIADRGQFITLNSSQWLFSWAISSARNAEKSRFLLNRNVELALENLALREAGLENDRLRLALGLKQRKATQVTIPAEVTGRDSDLIFDTIKINAGADRGVQKDWTVVTSEGLLVGHVSQVEKNCSIVQLIRRSRVSAVVQESRAKGIVFRRQDNFFELRYIEANEANNAIQVGDRVVTSGLGGRFPEGILIGEIVDVRDQKRDPLFKKVILESGVDFSKVEEVFVMRFPER